jgi:hypothetical protein
LLSADLDSVSLAVLQNQDFDEIRKASALSARGYSRRGFRVRFDAKRQVRSFEFWPLRHPIPRALNASYANTACKCNAFCMTPKLTKVWCPFFDFWALRHRIPTRFDCIIW